jgi:hypothetical protein
MVFISGCSDGKVIEDRYISEKFRCSIQSLDGFIFESLNDGIKIKKTNYEALNFYHFKTEAQSVDEFYDEKYETLVEFASPIKPKKKKAKIAGKRAIEVTFVGNEAYESMDYKMYFILEQPYGYAIMYYCVINIPEKQRQQAIADLERMARSLRIGEQ